MVVIVKSEMEIGKLDSEMQTFGLQRIGRLFDYDKNNDQEQIKISVDLF